MSDTDPFLRYRTFLERVDAHAARVTEAHASRLRCRLGCTACCRQDLAVSRIEAEHILGWLLRHGLPEADPARTVHDDHPRFEALAGDEACTFLGKDGACGIYPVRPLICRTHGLPVQLTRDEGDDAPTRDICPLNLETDEVTLDTLDPSDVLDLDRLNALFAMLDRLYGEETGEQALRIPLSALREMAG